MNTKLSNIFIDKIFWFVLILFTNPGGIQQTLDIYNIFGRTNLNDFLFVIMLACYLLTKSHTLSTKESKKLKTRIIVFAIYYFLIFGYITPSLEDDNVNNLFNFIKMRFALYNLSMFFFTYTFWKRSYLKFFKFFTVSSIIILIIFLQSLITNFEILTTTAASRGFIDLNRIMLLSYGLMPFFTALGVVYIIFKYRGRFSFHILLGFILMNTAWLVSLTRRHILGLIFTLIIGLLIFVYINRTNILKPVGRFNRIIFFILFLLIIVGVSFPKYLNSAYTLIESSISVIKTGENISGKEDERLAFFGRKKMVEEFNRHPFLGTGFANIWRTSEGDKEGYEASDYPFQATLAKNGLLGLLFYLPVYLVLIGTLKNDLIFCKKNKHLLGSFEAALLLSFIIYFIFNLIQYMNWFGPVSNSGRAANFYILLAAYFASREIFYNKIGIFKKMVSAKNLNSID